MAEVTRYDGQSASTEAGPDQAGPSNDGIGKDGLVSPTRAQSGP
jgi:hypothetical protein